MEGGSDRLRWPYVSGTVRLYLPDEVEEWMLVQAAGGDRRDAPVGESAGVDARKPLFDPREERHAAARILKRLAAQRQALRLGLLDHPGHVREDHVGVLLFGQRVGLGPELLVALADGRNEVVFLHVARSERSVEVVDQCYGKSEFHRFQSFDFKAAKNQMAAKPYGMRFGKTFRQMKGPQRPRHQR